MATERQIQANRQNAQKSTGPVTPEGKKASALNALKSGLYAHNELLPWENEDDYAELVATMYRQFAPASPLAVHYLDDAISSMWEVRRIRQSISQVHTHSHDRDVRPNKSSPIGQVIVNYSKVLSTTQWRLDATRRALENALRSLAAVQASDVAQASLPVQVEQASLPNAAWFSQ